MVTHYELHIECVGWCAQNRVLPQASACSHVILPRLSETSNSMCLFHNKSVVIVHNYDESKMVHDGFCLDVAMSNVASGTHTSYRYKFKSENRDVQGIYPMAGSPRGDVHTDASG